jgi:hypothetical protein
MQQCKYASPKLPKIDPDNMNAVKACGGSLYRKQVYLEIKYLDIYGLTSAKLIKFLITL